MLMPSEEKLVCAELEEVGSFRPVGIVVDHLIIVWRVWC